VLQLLCVQSILIAGSMVLIAHVHGDDLIPAIFFIVFPSIILFVVSFLAGRGDPMTQAAALYPTAQFPPDRDPITLGGIVFGLSRFASNVLGSLILAFSLLVALAVVTDLPGLFESGVLDPNMPQQLDQNFGTHNWPRIMNHVGAAISFITAMIASGFLLVPRRRYGAFHMFRAIVAIGILFASMMALGHNLPDWGTISPGESAGASIDTYLQAVHVPGVFWGGILFMLGVFMLLWPAPKRRVLPYSAPQVAAGQVDVQMEKPA
jgi:hypothetical protein